MKKRILFCTTDYSAFTAPLIRAFNHLEFDVKQFDYKKGSLLTRVFGFTANRTTATKASYKQVHSALLQKQLLNIAAHWKPDLVFVIKGETLTPDTLITLKKKRIPTLNWYPDWMVLWDTIKTHAPLYTYYFTMCTDLEQSVKKINPHTHFFPPAAEPDQKNNTHKNIEISFVGQYSLRRERYFSAVSDFGLRIWGYDQWQKSKLRNFSNSEISFARTLKILRSSKIVLNMLTGDDSFQPNAINNRTFETLGVGSFLLVQKTPLLLKYFTDGVHLVTFTSPLDLRKKAEYYLKHVEKRQQIAENGLRFVQQHHTYTHRLQEMLQLIEIGQSEVNTSAQ